MKDTHAQNIVDAIEFGAGSLLKKILMPLSREEAQKVLDQVPNKKRNDLWYLLAIDYGTYQRLTGMLSLKKE